MVADTDTRCGEFGGSVAERALAPFERDPCC
jgi:hypothetical protein